MPDRTDRDAGTATRARMRTDVGKGVGSGRAALTGASTLHLLQLGERAVSIMIDKSSEYLGKKFVGE